MQTSDAIRQKLQSVPDKPGCYIMRDKRGKIIYVGKAVSLRKRVTYYFRQSTLRRADPKLRGLIKSAADIEFVIAKTEADAVLTEGQLIKDYRPRYNIDFKDDKRFPLLRVDPGQPFPRFELCRIQRGDSREYFGPYTSASGARAALDFIEKKFGLRKCRPVIPAPKDHEHCINDIVRFCSAPCVGRIDKAAYADRVALASAFLHGERPEDLAELKARMEEAAAATDFEKAAALRDTLLRLREIISRRARVLRTPEMKHLIARQGIEELGRVLGMSTPPRTIEAYDVSNISGTFAVASMVCAVDGVPQRQRYRRFKIRTVSGADDPAMLAEAVSRSILGKERAKMGLPDLILADGGEAQVRSVRGTLAAAGMARIPVAGLAKKHEEIHWKEGEMPIRLVSDSAALLVLRHIRDEAHRFALAYHHVLRRKQIRDSVLDEIPGIGAERKKRLLVHFGSVQQLQKAEVEEIASVSGVGKALAGTIHAALSGAGPEH